MLAARKSHVQRLGMGQLTLVEHALCPLDARPGAAQQLVHRARFRFSDARGRRQTAHATVFAPLGLAPHDELYLWGLLALTLTHAPDDGTLQATPHWCLRQLDLIDPHTRRGGRQYQRFAESLRRLAVVRYVSDSFYDPVRREHRRVAFGFFSYSLPEDPDSQRCWRIVWDPVFFELVRAAAGHFRFDWACYRQLDPASRRLFLFACKVLSRRSELPAMRLTDLAVELLGFSSTLAARDMKVKVGRVVQRLKGLGVVRDARIEHVGVGEYRVTLTRGDYFTQRPTAAPAANLSDHPLWQTLEGLGFEADAAARLLRRYPHRLLAEWADITAAARERFGLAFFKKSPMAYFVDSVRAAARGTRTPPDWWHDLRRAEARQADSGQEAAALFARLQAELFGPAPAAPSSPPAETTAPRRIGDLLRDFCGDS